MQSKKSYCALHCSVFDVVVNVISVVLMRGRFLLSIESPTCIVPLELCYQV